MLWGEGVKDGFRIMAVNGEDNKELRNKLPEGL